MYGVSVKVDQEEVCVYNECDECACKRCVKKVLFAFRRFQIQPLAVDKTHSVAYKFSQPFDALRAVEALKHAGVRAKIIFPV